MVEGVLKINECVSGVLNSFSHPIHSAMPTVAAHLLLEYAMNLYSPTMSLIPPATEPVSSRIKERIEQAGKRHFANDNISEFLLEGELDELQSEVEGKVREMLKSMVIDVESVHNTQDTARRVAKMFLREVYRGRFEEAPNLTEFPNIAATSELTLVGPIKVRSACSHHLCPIMGQVWIGILPDANSNLIGLSKYARMTDWVMSRPQIQEEAVAMLADELEARTKPAGLAVVMEADHFCMHWRGVKDDGSKMTSSIMRGEFLTDASLRREFLSLRAM